MMEARAFVVAMSKPGTPSRFTHTHSFTSVVVATWGCEDEASLKILQDAFADKEWLLETSRHVQELVGQSLAQALALSFAQKNISFSTEMIEP